MAFSINTEEYPFRAQEFWRLVNTIHCLANDGNFVYPFIANQEFTFAIKWILNEIKTTGKYPCKFHDNRIRDRDFINLLILNILELFNNQKNLSSKIQNYLFSDETAERPLNSKRAKQILDLAWHFEKFSKENFENLSKIKIITSTIDYYEVATLILV
jgi:hypothetical protein